MRSRRGHFLDDFFEFLDHVPRFANHLRLIRHVAAEDRASRDGWIAGEVQR